MISISQMALAAIPKWSDIFSSLKPYEDPKEVDAFDFEEVGDPRFGIVQLNTGTVSYNATLNLTGHILLGIGIATAILIYMFKEALRGKPSHHEYGHYDRKRSIFDDDEMKHILLDRIPEVIEQIDEKLKHLGLDESECRLRITCEAGSSEDFTNYHQEITMRLAINQIFKNLDESSINKFYSNEIFKAYYLASRKGQRRKSCKEEFPKCRLSFEDIGTILRSNF